MNYEEFNSIKKNLKLGDTVVGAPIETSRRFKIIELDYIPEYFIDDVFIDVYKWALPDDVRVVCNYKDHLSNVTRIKIWSSQFDNIASTEEYPVQQIKTLNKEESLIENKPMLKITQDQINSVRKQLGTAKISAVGYRLMVKIINATNEMEAVEANKHSTLAAKGFVVKSDDQQSRETKGENVGIVVNCGPDAYKSNSLKDRNPWVKEGDVVIFPRYAGHSCELPPGSGEYYQFMDDDDLVGKYKEITL